MDQSIWAIDPSALFSVDGILSLSGFLSHPPRADGPKQRSTPGSIAVLHLCGVIAQRPAMGLLGGSAYGLVDFQAAFRAALEDPGVRSILIDVDSPGGSVYGVQELAKEIYAARGKKQIVAVANSMAASAAYWIASAAGEFYVTPGGEVGSIGVYLTHFDLSQAKKKEGISTTMISAGKYKVEGNPYQPLDADARKFMQSRVDDYYRAFTGAVARHRKTTASIVRSRMGGGRLLGATAARSAGMVDGVATYRDVLSRMLGAR
ncbi:S49 family peptidase [Burkholderia vietnamiensis]|uniref:S49 family peptidase n=1 Tax=Burkholderia vietnamiensis TaxID=60552 RepID=UPI00264AAB13|nr:S49 family peptidase [Burkholderia vietnamiensis]MDN8065928.1 S49 family peptidase [Burkholderia vietnamiensis]